MKQRKLTISILSITFLAACGTEQPETLGNANEVEAIMSQYYDDIAAYDYAAMRAVYTPAFEILDDGSRLDANGFEELVQGIEARGLTWNFNLSEFNTEITADIAYTTYVITSPPDFRWFGAGILRRSNDGWLVDRMTMMTEAEPQGAQPTSGDEG